MISNIDIPCFEKQLEFLSITARYGLLESGIGFGKTYIGCLWIAITALKYPNTRGLIVARDVPQLRTATLVEFKKILTNVLKLKENVDFIHNQSNNTFTFSNGTVIVSVGANNYDSAFRGPNYSYALLDEADYYKKEAYQTIKGRIRVFPELIRITSSPKGYNFIWEDFYQNQDETRVRVNATSLDNPLLSKAYLEDLKKAYSPRLYEQEVLGHRLNLMSGSVYSEFNREKHVKPCKDIVTKDDMIYFFTDYNISNYCGVYMVFKEGIIYCLGEEHLKFQGSRIMAQKVSARYPNNPVTVIGDSTGNNKRTTEMDKTNYQHFEQAGLYTKPFRNPAVQTRIISADSNLYHGKIVIDPECKTLIKDLELVVWKDNGAEIDKSDIDLTHSSDAATYGFWYFLPLKRSQPKSATRYL